MARRARAVLAALFGGGVSIMVVAAGCSSGAPTSAVQPCSQSTSALNSGPVLLTAAAVESVEVEVGSTRDLQPHCVGLDGSAAVYLMIGDRFQVVANYPPEVRPSHSRSVRIATGAGPAGHIVATVTGEAPGTATVSWIDCSGPQC